MINEKSILFKLLFLEINNNIMLEKIKIDFFFLEFIFYNKKNEI